MTIRVLEVLDGDRAIVSTRGLRRVFDAVTGEILEELVLIEDAREMAAANARCYSDGASRLRIRRYSQTA